MSTLSLRAAARSSVRRAIRDVLLTAAITAAGVASVGAQEKDPTIDEIIVTGSRVRARDFESTSPVTTVSAEAINATGQLSVEEVLNRLPQIVPGLSATSNNPANGTATVDLLLGAVTATGLTELIAEIETFEVALQHEVHDACERIGAVNG